MKAFSTNLTPGILGGVVDEDMLAGLSMADKMKGLEKELYNALLKRSNGARVMQLTRQYEKLHRNTWLGSFSVYEAGTYFQFRANNIHKAVRLYRMAAKSKFGRVRALALSALGIAYLRGPKIRSSKRAKRWFNEIIRERPRSKAAATARKFRALCEPNVKG